MRVQENKSSVPAVSAPQPSPPPSKPVSSPQGRDHLQLADAGAVGSERSSRPNPLASSPGRTAADIIAGVAGAADGARGIAPAARAIRAGSRAGGLGRLGALTVVTAKRMESAVAAWGRFSKMAPGVAKVAIGLARSAPFLGVGIATLDVGRAIIEDNPAKQHEATGLAALSVTAAGAGLVGAGAASGLTVAGLALAPLAIPATVIGLSATALALTDQFLLGGRLTRPIGRGLQRAYQAVAGAF